ncbi:MAG: CRISPR-associated protein Cas4 [Candidatus Aenigmatarchaeota archaeon]
MANKQFLSAKDLMNYHYCPRIVYYEHVLKSPQVTTIKELNGRRKYEIFKKKSKRNKVIYEFPRMKKLYDVALFSEKLGLITKLDCIIVDEENKLAYPVQVKDSVKPRKIYRTQRIQIELEKVLIEEKLGYKVPFGFIKFLKSGELVKVFTKGNELEITLNEINKIIKSEKFPIPTRYRNRCMDCCYRKNCWGD